MAGDQIRRGSTLLISGTHQNANVYHLCIILNDPPDEDPQQFLYVPVITARKKYDPTCILEDGDHEFIDHKSCVHYARAQVRSVQQFTNRGPPKEPLRDDVLERVCRGIFDSPHSAPWVKEFYRTHN